MMRESTPPLGVQLPTGQAQALARQTSPAQHAVMPMLLASALLWAAVWGLVYTFPKTPVAAPAAPYIQPLSVKTFGTPTLTIALAEAPRPIAPNRKAERVRGDLLSLFGHVAGTLVRDELETMVLRLSLGQQVALHLRQDFLE